MKIREWSCGSPSFSHSRYQVLIDRAGLQAFLDRALEVDEQAWWRNSHVALCDAEGALSLEDGRTGRWLVRPGGLGQLRWDDGSVTYLVDHLP